MVQLTFTIKVNPKIRETMTDDERNRLAFAIQEYLTKGYGPELFEIMHD